MSVIETASHQNSSVEFHAGASSGVFNGPGSPLVSIPAVIHEWEPTFASRGLLRPSSTGPSCPWIFSPLLVDCCLASTSGWSCIVPGQLIGHGVVVLRPFSPPPTGSVRVPNHR